MTDGALLRCQGLQLFRILAVACIIFAISQLSVTTKPGFVAWLVSNSRCSLALAYMNRPRPCHFKQLKKPSEFPIAVGTWTERRTFCIHVTYLHPWLPLLLRYTAASVVTLSQCPFFSFFTLSVGTSFVFMVSATAGLACRLPLLNPTSSRWTGTGKCIVCRIVTIRASRRAESWGRRSFLDPFCF